jgi:hypothetical protein
LPDIISSILKQQDPVFLGINREAPDIAVVAEDGGERAGISQKFLFPDL